MRRRAATLGVLLLLAATAAPAASHAALRTDHRGRWLTDRYGRVVILHGVNMVDKLPPYDPATLGFGADDAALLERSGFDSIRLGVILKAVEPTKGHFDDAYLASIKRTVDMLGRRGLRVVLDFHQDLYNERFDGEGFPDWMVQDDGLPAQPDGGFPANYFAMPALWRAFDHLWANDGGLQDDYAAAWQHVAAQFAGDPAILGYDTFNEPWPGSDWESCLQPAGCPLFDATLTAFFTKVFHAIRTVDDTHMVFYEPNPETAGTGSQTYIGDTGDPNAGFSFHFYCLDALGWPGSLGAARCPAGEDRPFQVADSQSQATGDALLMSEFGASDDLQNLGMSLDTLDRHMMSWDYWTYYGRDVCCARPNEGIIRDPHKPPTGANIKWRKLRLLARPYPRAVAGTPVRWELLPPGGQLEVQYRSNPSIAAPTEIVVPRLSFRHGYTVRITGPGRVISDPNATVLRVANTGRGLVVVTVRSR